MNRIDISIKLRRIRFSVSERFKPTLDIFIWLKIDEVNVKIIDEFFFFPGFLSGVFSGYLNFVEDEDRATDIVIVVNFAKRNTPSRRSDSKRVCPRF